METKWILSFALLVVSKLIILKKKLSFFFDKVCGIVCQKAGTA
jgi:hypothetical protein